MTYLVGYWVPLIALLVQAATLAALIRYTIITARIERAAQEQAEASQKPVIVLQCIPRSDRQDEGMELLAQKHVPPGCPTRAHPQQQFHY